MVCPLSEAKGSRNVCSSSGAMAVAGGGDFIAELSAPDAGKKSSVRLVIRKQHFIVWVNTDKLRRFKPIKVTAIRS